MVLGSFDQIWKFNFTPIKGFLASGMESATTRWINQVWDHTSDPFEFFSLSNERYRVDQTDRVRVKGAGEYLITLRHFNYVPSVHHRDPVTEFGSNRQIVSDEDDRVLTDSHEVVEQLENLRLDRHVER
jgi:hypothetical protein